MKEVYFVNYEILPEWYDPENLFKQLFKDNDHAFWLDSSKVVDGFSRFSYMGEAKEVIRYSLNGKSEDIFSVLQKKLNNIRVTKTSLPFDFVGGYVGYFGYELKALCGFSNHHTSPYPDSIWYFIDRLFVFDHKEHKVYLMSLTNNKKSANEWFTQMKNLVSSRLHDKSKQVISTNKLQLAVSKEEYLEAINECKSYLKKGESYEICLTNRLKGVTQKDPFTVYKQIRKINPAPYAGYFRDGDLSVLSSSPERFLKIDQDGWAEAKPMKGTIERSLDSKKDQQLAAALLHSEKDRAENLMIVDLLRNDLGKVCEIGSVEVSDLMKVETYQTVHQMVSVIRGKLRRGVSVLECIKACFPGGSMTGAPKKRTIEILDNLEKSARGVYSGALGYLSANGAVDLNIVIRTMVMQKGEVSVGTGGAITYQSDPHKEFEEMMLKVKALQMALSD